MPIERKKLKMQERLEGVELGESMGDSPGRVKHIFPPLMKMTSHLNVNRRKCNVKFIGSSFVFSCTISEIQVWMGWWMVLLK